MKTFKEFQEQLNKPNIDLGVKAMGGIGTGAALLVKTVSGMLRGKHKNRRIFKKKGS